MKHDERIIAILNKGGPMVTSAVASWLSSDLKWPMKQSSNPYTRPVGRMLHDMERRGLVYSFRATLRQDAHMRRHWSAK